MDWKDIAKQAADIGLPLLGTALGGPGGGLIGKALASAIGAGGKPEDVLAVLKESTQAQAQARQFEAEQEVALKRLALDEKRADNEDRASARAREATSGGYTVPTLAFVILGAFFAFTGAILLGYTHIDSALMGTLVGYLSAKAEQVISYYFGGSSPSQLAGLTRK